MSRQTSVNTDHSSALMRLCKINYQKQGLKLLNEIDLCIYPGTNIQIRSTQNCHANTLIALLSGKLHPTSYTGHIKWREQYFAPQSPRQAIHKGIYLLSENNLTVPHLSVFNNICLNHDTIPDGNNLKSSDFLSRTTEMISWLEIQTTPESLASSLNYSQTLLIALARALLNQAKIIILDCKLPYEIADTHRGFEKIMNFLNQSGASIIYTHTPPRNTQYCEAFQSITSFSVNSNRITSTAPFKPQVNSSETSFSFSLINFSFLKKPPGYRSIKPVSFDLKSGDIINLKPTGDCRISDLFKALSGDNAYTAYGQILIDDWFYRFFSTFEARQAGVCRLPFSSAKTRSWHPNDICQQAARDWIPCFSPIQNKVWFRILDILEITEADLTRNYTNIRGHMALCQDLAYALIRYSRIILIDLDEYSIPNNDLGESLDLLEKLTNLGQAMIVSSEEAALSHRYPTLYIEEEPNRELDINEIQHYSIGE